MSEVKRWYVDEWSACREANDGPFVKYDDHAALAERLAWAEAAQKEYREQAKAMDAILEGYKERLKSCEEQLNKPVQLSEWQQLTADLKDSSEEIVMNHQEIERLRADLDRARAEVEDCRNTLNDERYCHGQTIDSLKRISSQMLAETRHERDTLTQSNERLMAALVGIGNFVKAHHLEQERDSHLWLHALIVDIPSMVESALKETTAGERGGYATEQQQ